MPLRSVRPLMTPPEETIVTPSALIVVADVVPPDATSCWNLTIVPTARPPRVDYLFADDQGVVVDSCVAGNAAGKNGLIANRHHGADRTAAGRNGFLAKIETGVTDPGCAGNAAAAENLRSAGDQGTDGRAALADGRGAAAGKNRGAGNATRNVYSAAGFDQRSDRSPRDNLERSIEHGRLQRCAARQHKLFANGLEDRSQREAAARNGLRGNSEHGIVGFAAGKDRLRGFED